ncbi:MAG: peptidoglycan-binding domain-containing protein [Acidimicrobiia bacterium]|nr:peptidoglycan-binding domain-containing protein [Acidimicrobiia bacterium]
MLRNGSRGDEVTELQEALAEAGHDPGPVDGVFGPKTEAAVRAFQEAKGLQVDGIVGPNTLGALDEATAEETVMEKAKRIMAERAAEDDDSGFKGL